jgi:prepilin-type N-terminal cleavage/methylation domain-containing protein
MLRLTHLKTGNRIGLRLFFLKDNDTTNNFMMNPLPWPSRIFRCGLEMRTGSGAKSAFTLVELLVVISIMSVLAAVTTWSIYGNQTSGRANAAILTLGGFVDECRQYAIANNTYVYVGICQNPAATGPASEVWLGAVASSDGTDVSSAGKNTLTVGTNVKAISKLMILQGVDIQNATQSQFATATNWTAPSGATDASQPGAAQIGPLGAANAMIPLSFYFAPDGSVSTNGTVTTCLALGLEISAGSTPSHHVDPAVFQVTGLTGITKVFRQ